MIIFFDNYQVTDGSIDYAMESLPSLNNLGKFTTH